MKVLVTGAGGQLGRALGATAPEGAEVAGLLRADVDIADERAVMTALDVYAPDLLVNAAAYTAVDKAETDEANARLVNRDGAALLARLTAERGIRLAHVSTDFVFDGSSSTPARPDQPMKPLGVYGATKAEGETAIRQANEDALIVRTAWVYAARGKNFVATMLRLMRSQATVRVVADQLGTPTHATSLARAIWTLTGLNARGVHHFTDAGVASWYDFAVAIQEEAMLLGLLGTAVPVIPIRTEDYPTPAKRPPYSVLDKTETYAALGGPARHWRVELRGALGEIKTLESN